MSDHLDRLGTSLGALLTPVTMLKARGVALLSPAPQADFAKGEPC